MPCTSYTSNFVRPLVLNKVNQRIRCVCGLHRGTWAWSLWCLQKLCPYLFGPRPGSSERDRKAESMVLPSLKFSFFIAKIYLAPTSQPCFENEMRIQASHISYNTEYRVINIATLIITSSCNTLTRYN